MSRSDRGAPPSPKAPAQAVPAATLTQRATRDAGTPLDGALRGTMEGRFGADFGSVRVHADASAAESARATGAAAVTVGRDIVFGAGRYQPASSTGRQLLAHELAHVVQQSRGGSDSDTESRADAAADAVSQGRSVEPQALGGAPVSVQAKPDDAPAVDTGTAFPTQTIAGFALNGAEVPAERAGEIEKLAWSISLHLGIRKNGRATISIVGHTDRSGDEKTNMTLGQQRADAAKRALADALKKQGVGDDQYGDIATSSMGESSPAVPTADGVKNDKNRRVEISVNVGSKVVVAPAAPTPKFDPFTPLPPGTLQPDKPVGPPRRDPSGDEMWRRMEETRKKIEDFDKKHPPTNKSLSDALIDTVMDNVLDPLIKKLPVSKRLQDLARSGVRKGLEKGSEAACESAIDAAGAKGPEAEALKSACKAALKTKPGGDGAPKP